MRNARSVPICLKSTSQREMFHSPAQSYKTTSRYTRICDPKKPGSVCDRWSLQELCQYFAEIVAEIRLKSWDLIRAAVRKLISRWSGKCWGSSIWLRKSASTQPRCLSVATLRKNAFKKWTRYSNTERLVDVRYLKNECAEREAQTSRKTQPRKSGHHTSRWKQIRRRFRTY